MKMVYRMVCRIFRMICNNNFFLDLDYPKCSIKSVNRGPVSIIILQNDKAITLYYKLFLSK